MLHDRKPKSRAAHLFRMAFIDPVEPFEDTFLIFRCDPNPGITDRKKDFCIFVLYIYGHFSIFTIILDGIVAKIINDTV